MGPQGISHAIFGTTPSLADSDFAVTYAVYDSQAEQWVTRDAPTATENKVKSIISDIEKISSKSSICKVFSRKSIGNQFRIDSQGNILQLNRKTGEWIDLLEKENDPDVRRQLLEVAKRLASIESVSDQIRVEVKVDQPKLRKALQVMEQEEEEILNNLEGTRGLTATPALLQKFNRLIKASKRSRAILQETARKLASGNSEEMMTTYAREMAAHFPEYIAALEEFIESKKLLDKQLKEHSPLLHLPITRVDDYRKLFARLLVDATDGIHDLPSEKQAALTKQWSEDYSTVNRSFVTYSEKLSNLYETKLDKHLSEAPKDQENQVKQFSGWLKDIKANEKQLEHYLHEEGLTLMDARPFIRALERVLPAYETLVEQELEVKHLLRKVRGAELIEKYGQMMASQLPSLYEALPAVIAPQIILLGDKQFSEKLQKAFQNFQKSLGRHVDSNVSPEASLTRLIRLPVWLSDIMTAAKKYAEGDRVVVPTSYLEVLDIAAKGAEEIHVEIGEYADTHALLTAPLKFEASAKRLKTAISSFGPREQKFLDEVAEAYAKVLVPLVRGGLALRQEQDPQKKQLFRLQLQHRVQEATLVLQKIEKRFEAWGGLTRLEALQKSSSPLESQFNQLESRIFFFHQLQEDLGLKAEIDTRIFETRLVKPSFVLDPEWQRLCAEHHVERSDLRRLADLDHHVREGMASIIIAAKALEQDPDNEKLQEDLEKLVMGEKRNLEKGMAAIGQWEGLSGLKQAQSAFREILHERLLKETNEIEREGIQKQLEEVAFDPTEVLKLRDKRLNSLYEKMPFMTDSWQPGFVSKRLSRSNLRKTSFWRKEDTEWQKAWKKLVSSYGITFGDLDELSRLYDELGRELSPLRAKERELQQKPHSKPLAKELTLLAAASSEKIRVLSRKLDGWNDHSAGSSDKLTRLQGAIDTYRGRIDRRLQFDKERLRRLEEELFKNQAFRDLGGKVEISTLEKEIAEIKAFRQEFYQMSLDIKGLIENRLKWFNQIYPE